MAVYYASKAFVTSMSQVRPAPDRRIERTRLTIRPLGRNRHGVG